MELVGPILEFVNRIWAPISKCLKYHRNLDENVEDLRIKLEELNSRKGDIESKMQVELCPGKNPKEEVEFWLRQVQRINGEIQTLEGEVRKRKYFSRASLGRSVSKKIKEVEELHQKGSFSHGLVIDSPTHIGAIFPTINLEGETTSKRKMEEIWACLLNDHVRKIGIYGMGGSGKTTIMKHINNRILEETDKFDSVIWIAMSKVLNVIKLQNDIASAFKANISEHEDEATRAAKLLAILRDKKRYVLILDDIWEAFHLEVVGIPEPTVNNGCKILLTTRSLDVCRGMNCKDIKMELLSEGEAWNLFLDNVGHDVLRTPSIEETAKLVAKECARLPLAIITIAGSMKGVGDEYEWRNALEELRESTKGLHDMGKVLEQLKYSYNRLKDEMLQHCFLYCALYPEDFEVQRREVIEYLIVEGIIEGTSRQAEFDKGYSILNKLENACLLESCTGNTSKKCVKMHDLVRDMALNITRVSPRFMVKANVQLKELPNEQEWKEDLEKVSLMWNNISEIPSEFSPICQRLSTLLLQMNPLERISNSFFTHMQGLKVLDLSYTDIDVLPYNISKLENLTALLLRWCSKLKSVPPLAKLRALRKLDLSGTGVEEVPQGMEMLVNLRYLNLDAFNLKTLPVGMLPKLSHLQCLIVWWGSKSNTLKVKGEEVASLRKLESFAGQLYDLHDFNMYVRSLQGHGPRNYLLQVGQGERYIYFDEEGADYSKYVGLRKCCISRGGEYPLVLPKDIEFLVIEECHDVRSLCDISSLNNATDFFKSCRIINCDGIKCVLSSSSSSYCTPLQSLEVLWLEELRNLHVFFRQERASPPPPGTFSLLKELHIKCCPKIKKLFTPQLLQHLQNLERISVRDCEGMEEIIATQEEEEEEEEEEKEKEEEEEEEEEEKGMGERSNSIVITADTIFMITLPKLRDLYLWHLPILKSIVCCRGIKVCDSLQEITVYGCPELKRLPFSLPLLNGQPSPPLSLKRIYVDSREWWESLEWDYPSAKNVLQPFVHIG